MWSKIDQLAVIEPRFHSKLLLVDGSFFTLGSANMNQRSMAVDSELNMACNDRGLTEAMRKRIWSQMSGKSFDGASAKQAELKLLISDWKKLQDNNRKRKRRAQPMIGFLLPVEDDRSETIRLG